MVAYSGPFKVAGEQLLSQQLSLFHRLSELLAATWRNIDLEKLLWIIPAVNGKNGKEQQIQLSDFSARQLERVKERSNAVALNSPRFINGFEWPLLAAADQQRTVIRAYKTRGGSRSTT
jgi:integrase